MPNPFRTLTDWLTGADLRTPAIERLSQKMYYIDDIRAAMLIHGPGATDVLNGSRGDPSNSAAFACLTAICTAYSEAMPQVYKAAAPGDYTPQLDSPLQQLLDIPNPHIDPNTLWWWVQWAKHVDGNAYLRKLRAGDPENGNVVQLWPISPARCVPVTEKNSTDFISYYDYEYAPGKKERIAPRNIIHFRLGLDDNDFRLGLSPLKRAVREVSSDNEATAFADALLKNFAVPGLVVMPDKDSNLTEETAVLMKERIAATFGSDSRGRVGVLTAGAKMEQFGFSPEQMDLKGLHRLPEERIAAVLRVPPMIAGLGAGLERSTYSNYKEAREMFTEQTILPLYASDSGVLNMQLVPDFRTDRSVFVAFDTSQLRALQEDVDAKFARYDLAVRGRWITPNEARAAIGLPPLPGGDVVAAAPTLPVADGKTRTLSLKASDLEDFPDLVAAIAQLAAPSFEADLEDYFEKQKRRVKRALVSGQ